MFSVTATCAPLPRDSHVGQVADKACFSRLLRDSFRRARHWFLGTVSLVHTSLQRFTTHAEAFLLTKCKPPTQVVQSRQVILVSQTPRDTDSMRLTAPSLFRQTPARYVLLRYGSRNTYKHNQTGRGKQKGG